MNPDLAAILFSWAVSLSGIHAPEAPEVVTRPHAFFVAEACGGRECKVYGWYAGGHTVFVDDRLSPEDTLNSSIVVHEMVHYLQHERLRDHPELVEVDAAGVAVCRNAIRLEMEAYGVQREYLRQYGVYQPVGMSMLQVGCDGTTAVAAAGH